MVDLKMIKQDTDLSKVKMHKLSWDVMVQDKPFYVYDIEGFVHTISSLHGNVSYWAAPRDEVPTYKNLIPYNGVYGPTYSININESNRFTFIYGDDDINSFIKTDILRNNKVFYSFNCRDMDYAYNKARMLLYKINEFPTNFNDIDFDKKLIGRKIWYRNDPAIITSYVDHQACVIIEPDGIKYFKVPEYFKKEDGEYYTEDEGTLKINILEDNNIWWFR